MRHCSFLSCQCAANWSLACRKSGKMSDATRRAASGRLLRPCCPHCGKYCGKYSSLSHSDEYLSMAHNRFFKPRSDLAAPGPQLSLPGIDPSLFEKPIPHHPAAPATSSLRCAMRASFNLDFFASTSPAAGITTLVKPSFSASLSRVFICPAVRTAPDRLTSPK